MAAPNTTGLNETFDLLKHPHRRYVLYYLTNEYETVGVDTLAAAIARWDGDHAGTGRSADGEAVETALHHTHLPKLAGAGIVTFGPDGETVELCETEVLERFLADAAHIDGYVRTVADD